MNNRILLLFIAICFVGINVVYATETAKKGKHDYDAESTSALEKLVSTDFSQSYGEVLSLLNRKADPNVNTFHRRPLLHHAAMYNHDELVTAALAAGADPNVRCELLADTALMYAKSPKIAQQLLDNNADLHALDSHGNCLLYQAVINFGATGEFSAVLCNAGIHVNRQNKHGYTPLHSLFSYERAQFAKQTAVLLFSGADLTLKNNRSETPLDRLQEKVPDKVPSVQAIIAATPLVQQEKAAAYRTVLSSYFILALQEHLPTPLVSIAIDYANAPPWDKTCWPLFKKHMKEHVSGERVTGLL